MSAKHPTGRAVLSALLGLCFTLQAAADDTVFGAGDSAWVRNDTPHAYTGSYLDGDSFSSTYTIPVREADVGKQADLFLAAWVDGRWFMHNGERFLRWPDADWTLLQPMGRRTLSATETLSVLSGDVLFAGNYKVFAGYRTDGGELVYNRTPLSFTVHSSAADGLLKFRSPDAMSAYLKSAMQQGTEVNRSYDSAQVTLLESSSLDSASQVSTTNLQTDGVDEADVVKTDGNQLYILKGCEQGACLEVRSLDSSSAGSSVLASYELGNNTQPESMYLYENAGSKTLLTLSGRNTYWSWYSIWPWTAGKTTLEFLDTSDPLNISSREKLTIDGALVSSRRVGDILYLVTRYVPAVEEYIPYPTRDLEQDSNKQVLETTGLTDLLPKVTDSHKQSQALVSTENCYLPASHADKGRSPTIVTVSGISMQTAEVVSSSCFLGDTETLYMTTSSLYLATTSWDYVADARDSLVYSPDHTTTIHKFALAGSAIEYRGSGLVKGHLGWVEDKKSFRMGENGEYLNVVSSLGDTWNDSSSTRLTVLQEKNGSLQTVNTIDGIGKPGEQLYAARFVGDRAYLVTFRITDPLYIVDLSNQQQPVIAGELEISGYSDYLHPISENLLLGIGKDAVADSAATDRGPATGSWYQGVKIALFDVSDPAQPFEIDSKVLGKRGTESEVLWDHHAFTWLPPAGNEPARVSIPIRLHEDVPQWEGFDANEPNAWWDYTHTALYSFEVSSLGVTQVGRIVGSDRNSAPGGVVTLGLPTFSEFAPVFYNYADRSVLADDAVYFLHQGKVLSSFWGENKDLPAAESKE